MEAVKAIPMRDVTKLLSVPYNVDHHQRCPMVNHPGDNTPSIKYYENNSFACFGCKAGGSNIDLVMGVKELSFGQSIHWLEKNILKRRGYRHAGSKLASNLKELGVKLRKRVSRSSREQNFDAIAYATKIYQVIGDSIATLEHKSPSSLRGIIENRRESLYSYVDDQINNSSSESHCANVLQYVNLQLKALRNAVDDLPSQSRLIDGGDAKG